MEDLAAEALTVALLAASRAVVDGISAGVRARGFTDVRPAHGFAFARLARGDATITQLADHLDITRQAAAQLADELVAKGYIERRDHPDDGRAKLLVLTSKGWACTRAAEAAIAARHAEEALATTKKHQEEEGTARGGVLAVKEEAKPKSPTRAQLLAKGLKQCKKQPKKKRAKCEATVRRKYGSDTRGGKK